MKKSQIAICDQKPEPCSHPVKYWRNYGQNDKLLWLYRCEVQTCNQYHYLTREAHLRIKDEVIPQEVTFPLTNKTDRLKYDDRGYPIR